MQFLLENVSRIGRRLTDSDKLPPRQKYSLTVSCIHDTIRMHHHHHHHRWRIAFSCSRKSITFPHFLSPMYRHDTSFQLLLRIALRNYRVFADRIYGCTQHDRLYQGQSKIIPAWYFRPSVCNAQVHCASWSASTGWRTGFDKLAIFSGWKTCREPASTITTCRDSASRFATCSLFLTC